MNKEINLVVGFSEDEIQRIETHLERLLPHLTPNRFVLVGGIAIRHLLMQNGISYPNRSFNDIDIIVEDSSVVSPTVKQNFLIYHYHRQKDESFYIALVDPVSRTKTDIFDYQMPPEEVSIATFKDLPIKVPSVEDQLVKTVFDMQRISSNSRVDPKQFLDARLLRQIADLNKTDLFWKRKQLNQYPSSILSAIERAENIALEHPEWLQEKPFRKPKPYICNECVSTLEFPITPMEEVYNVLGYIE